MLDISLIRATSILGHSALCYDKYYFERSIRKTRIESDLQGGIEQNQLEFYYQIQVDHDRKPISAEALVRWNHPELGLLSPLEFIPIAEQSLLIVELGNHLLEMAFKQLLEWGQCDSTKHLTLSVNVTAKQYGMPDFISTITALLKKYPIDASKLTLELTESIQVADVGCVTQKMHYLKDNYQIKLSLDDFGTGYSSLVYLKTMPFDEIKIDQSFIVNIATSHKDAGLVKAIVALSKSYHFEVLAEGVETKAQFDYLREIGCHSFQGYLFSKPLPIDAFQDLLNQ